MRFALILVLTALIGCGGGNTHTPTPTPIPTLTPARQCHCGIPPGGQSFCPPGGFDYYCSSGFPQCLRCSAGETADCSPLGPPQCVPLAPTQTPTPTAIPSATSTATSVPTLTNPDQCICGVQPGGQSTCLFGGTDYYCPGLLPPLNQQRCLQCRPDEAADCARASGPPRCVPLEATPTPR